MNIKNILRLKPGTWALLLCLILFPFISWLYIREGVDYRIKNLEELVMKQPISGLSGSLNGNLPFTKDSLLGKVHVIVDIEQDSDLKTYSQLLEGLYKQNDGTRDIRVVVCTDSMTFENINLPAYITKYFVARGSDSIFLDLFEQFDQAYQLAHQNDNAVLVDKQSQIRLSYNLKIKEDIQKLIRHSAIVVPEYKRVSPELIRQDNY